MLGELEKGLLINFAIMEYRHLQSRPTWSHTIRPRHALEIVLERFRPGGGILLSRQDERWILAAVESCVE